MATIPGYTASGLPINQTFDAQGRPTSDVNGVSLTTPSPSSPSIVNSSTPTQNNINNLNTSIDKAKTQSFDLSQLLELFKPKDTTEIDANNTKLMQDRQAQLDKRRTDEITRLTTEYETEKARLGEQEAKDLEPIDRKLQLLKDTPYGPNAELETQLNTQREKMLQANKLELEHLYNTRENFIAQARNAYEDADYKFAESQMKAAKDAQTEIYNKQKDLTTLALQFSQENRLQAGADYTKQKDTRDFLVENAINQPYYTLGGVIFNSQTQQPEFENVNGEIRRLADGKRYGDKKDFFADTGLTSFQQIQPLGEGGVEQDLVIKYMLDYKDAGILPTDTLAVAGEKLKKSPQYLKSIKSGNENSDGEVPKEAEARNFLYEIKKNNPNKSWQEQWDEGARFLQNKGLNPTNYDKVFWEIFHPQGVRGYEAEYKKTSSQDELLNAFYTAMGVTPPSQ